VTVVVSVCRLCNGRGWLWLGNPRDGHRMVCWCRGGGFSIHDDPLVIPTLPRKPMGPLEDDDR
jgi:hypothetical protein